MACPAGRLVSSLPEAPDSVAVTKRTYYDDWLQLNGEARVSAVMENPAGDGTHIVMLDQTIFHPQGGGQPTDVGTMTSNGVVFTVQKVSADMATGHIFHIGSAAGGNFSSGDCVALAVDEETRRTCTRLHR